MKFNLPVNYMNKVYSTLILLLFSPIVLFAQSTTINGTVSGDGAELLGVNVLVKGTNNGVVTNFDGEYQIKANTNDVLIFSYLGFVTKEIKVAGRSTIDVVMKMDAAELEQVVVVGYGSVRRKDLTGSVVSVKAAELDKVKAVTFEGSLASRASGVQVTQTEGGPGAGFKIRIRGGTSINASSEPLYVIDGFALSGQAQSTSIGIGNSSTSPLNSIDPSTIESIEVLKDASATAIYGSRGANGVILITTKKGKKGRTEMNFESFTNVSSLARRLDLLTAQEFVDYRLEYTPWDPNNPNDQFVGAYRDAFGNPIDLKDPRVTLTDWQDEITRVAFTKSHKFSMAGGSENSSYAGSLSYLDQEGIIKTSKFERYNANLRLDQNLGKRWKSGININVGFSKRKGVVTAATENGNGRSGIVTNAVLFSPVQGITRYNDAEYDENGVLISLRNGDQINPLRRIENDINRGRSFQAFGNAYLQYKILDGLTFKTSIRGNFNTAKGQAYFSEQFGWGQAFGGIAFTNSSLGLGIITEQNLTFNRTFGNHGLNIVAVYEQQEGSFENVVTDDRGFNLPGVNLDNLGSALTSNTTRSSFSPNALKSYLARIQYDYSDRFVLNLSGRYDGSSRFGEGKKWGFFPSVGGAWKISNEEFLKDNNFVSNAKIRASYGETGNNQIPSFQSLPFTEAGGVILNGSQLITAASIDRLGNPNLTWETTAQYDVGLNLGFFNDRISIEADYYNKETTDLLLQVPVAPTSGFETAFQNIGALVNRGFEFSVSTVNIENNNFSWTTDFNISFNTNEVLNLGDAEEFFVQAIGDNQIREDYVIRVGESLGSIYGLEQDGVYNYIDFEAFDGLSDAEAAAKIRQDAEDQGIPYFDVVYTLKDGVVQSSGVGSADQYRPGLPKLKDQLTVDTDGDGVPDQGDGIVNSDDRTIIGRTAPLHFGGMTNNFKYKNFDLSILTSWSYGNDVYNKNVAKGSATAIPFFNKYGFVADRWTPENPNTDVPSVWGFGDAGITGNAYSSFVEDGSYIRINNITLGYNLSRDLLNILGLKSFRFYGSVDNVYVFTNYSGFDPDVSVGFNQLTPGLDSDSYPRARTFRLGVNVGF